MSIILITVVHYTFLYAQYFVHGCDYIMIMMFVLWNISSIESTEKY